MLGFHGISTNPISSLLATGAVFGSVTTAFSLSGAMTGTGALMGTSTSAFTVSGNGALLASLSGTASFAFTLTGNPLTPPNVWLNADGLAVVFGPQEGNPYPDTIKVTGTDLTGKLRYDIPLYTRRP